MRRLLVPLAVALAVVGLALPASADADRELVYLLPDSAGRYRPVVDSGGSVQVLANINSITPPVVSPDGRRVAFSGAVGNGSLGRYAIFLVDIDGTDLTQLTPGSFGELDPAWSPDGDTIVISQNQSGGLHLASCCRLALVEVDTGEVSGLTGSIGAVRPSFSARGSYVVYDNPSGVWRISPSGGSATQLTSYGRDATVSGDESAVAFVAQSGSRSLIQTVSSSGGAAHTVLSTTSRVENPQWRGNRIYFLEYSGDGYDGRSNVSLRSMSASGGDLRTHRSFSRDIVELSLGFDNDEIFFYRDDGLFRYYDIRSDGSLPSPMAAGDAYTRDWSAITSVDLDGDSRDEMFFYRDDGLFRYYDIRSDGSLPSPMTAGDAYTRDWTAITAVDLDGDGQDEMFFYRDDGLFRYYHVRPDGTLPSPLLQGDGYTRDWSSITAVDLDGDGQDEMFFYRVDGLFRYYDIRPNGELGSPIREGDDYPADWTSISAIDLDGDGQDEMFFYRDDGRFGFYEVDATGSLGPAISEGNGYTSDWSVITSVNLGPG